jgi:hypothetical protein
LHAMFGTQNGSNRWNRRVMKGFVWLSLLSLSPYISVPAQLIQYFSSVLIPQTLHRVLYSHSPPGQLIQILADEVSTLPRLNTGINEVFAFRNP